MTDDEEDCMEDYQSRDEEDLMKDQVRDCAVTNDVQVLKSLKKITFWEALEIASRGFFDAVLWCVENGVADENTMAHEAAESQNGDWEKIVRALLDSGKVRTTSLACCLARSGDSVLLQEVLKMSSTRATHPAIFMDAASGGSMEAIRVLLPHHGHSEIAEALAFSAANGHFYCVDFLKHHFPKHRSWWRHPV